MNQNQRTIKKEFSLSGIGLHTGNEVTVTFKPAPENSGISFIRVDLPGKPSYRANIKSVLIDKKVPRCTSIGEGDIVIHTVEHVMSVLCGLGIDNIFIELNGDEVPGLDGSAIDFLKATKNAGVVEQNAPRQYFKITEPISIESNDSSIFIFPADDFKVSYTLDYNHPILRSQFFSRVIGEEVFEKEIASSRTFCLAEEEERLRKLGLGRGANYHNTLVVDEKGVRDNELRFPDEFVRHKVLDIVGDMYLLGMPILGHVYAVKSGHTLNLALLQRIDQQLKGQVKPQAEFHPPEGATEIDIRGIMGILPHRYPFLFLDRVIELEKGKRAVGIKNVTINDNFFQGHFPSRPVMPGVLMLEAMAQTAGVVILTSRGHRGKVAVFMSIDNVKFRRVVVPGDQLLLEVELIRERTKTSQAKAVAKVGNEIVAEAEMMFSFTDANYLE